MTTRPYFPIYLRTCLYLGPLNTSIKRMEWKTKKHMFRGQGEMNEKSLKKTTSILRIV